MEMKFFKCEICGNMVAMVKESGAPLTCCGQHMTELIPNTTDAAQEKHVPVVTREDNCLKVAVGSVAHPMEDAHYIEWIAISTKNGNQRKVLKPGDKPELCFCISDDDEVEAVYEYCNIHGLWKA